MSEQRSIIDGCLYERNFDWLPYYKVSDQDLTSRVLNLEKVLAERDRFIAALQTVIDDQHLANNVLHADLAKAKELSDWWHDKYAKLKERKS